MSDAKPWDTGPDPGIAVLYRRHAAWLRRRLRRSIGATEAEDVVQEAYIRLAPYRSRGSIRNPKALLLEISRNLVRDSRRRAARRPETSLEEAPRANTQVRSEAFEEAAVKELILSIPPLYRETFVMSRYCGMTYPEIAKARQISVQTVEWRMRQAIAHCIAQLDR